MNWIPEPISPCPFCEHINPVQDASVGVKCAAFPEGVPQEILQGANLHRTPFQGQTNDLVSQPSGIFETPEKFARNEGTNLTRE